MRILTCATVEATQHKRSKGQNIGLLGFAKIMSFSTFQTCYFRQIPSLESLIHPNSARFLKTQGMWGGAR